MEIELDSARRLMTSVISRAQQLEVMVLFRNQRLRTRNEFARQWKVLRQSAERLYGILNFHDIRWTRIPEGSAEEIKQQEFYLITGQVENALADLDRQQAKLDSQWLQTWQDLENLHVDWMDSRRDFSNQSLERMPSLDSDLEAKLARLERLWAKVLEEDAAAIRERTALAHVWNRLMVFVRSRWVPAPSGSQENIYWERLVRRLHHMDQRWSNIRAVLRDPQHQEQVGFLRDRMSLLEAEIDAYKGRLDEMIQEREKALESLGKAESEKSRILLKVDKAESERKEIQGRLDISQAAWEKLKEKLDRANAQMQAADQQREDMVVTLRDTQAAVERFSARIQELEMILAATAAERDAVKQDLILARQDSAQAQKPAPAPEPLPSVEVSSVNSALEVERDRLAQQLRTVQGTLVSLQSELKSAKSELQTLRTQASAAASTPEPIASIPPSPPLIPPAPSIEESQTPIPSIEFMESTLEPVWAKVLVALRQSVTSAYTQLRRLMGGTLSDGQRTVAKLAATALSQAQDTLKVAGEFIDEGGTPPSLGRVENLVQSMLLNWEPALKARAIRLVRKIEPGVPEVLFQQDALRTAIYQIVRNAYEAMPRGGYLTVHLRLDSAGGQVRLSFADTGTGFSKSALENLFAPLPAARSGHLGLGLVLVRRVMCRFNGDAEAVNSPQGGAVVTLRFVSKTQAAPPPLRS